MSKHETTIDIILPFYNGSKFIGDQLRSIAECLLPQDTTFRVIIIDDYSEEKEASYLEQFKAYYSQLVIHRNDQNLGVVKSVEKGLRLSTADYIMLCDQDDFWLSDKILLSLDKIKRVEEGMPSLIFTDLFISDENLKPLYSSMFSLFDYHPEKIKHSILIQNMATGCTIIMNRALLKICLPFPENVSIHDHWLAMCATYAGNIGFLTKPTILYRQHSRNLIGAKNVTLFDKLKNLRSILLKKHNSHILKSEQTYFLAKRLKESKINTPAPFLEQVSKALQSNCLSDVFFLHREKILNFGLTRKILVTGFFTLVATYKTIRRQVIK